MTTMRTTDKEHFLYFLALILIFKICILLKKFQILLKTNKIKIFYLSSAFFSCIQTFKKHEQFKKICNLF